MGWSRKAAAVGGHQSYQGSSIKPDSKVYREHVDILRRINAPADVIKIAEKVAEANTVQTKSSKG